MDPPKLEEAIDFFPAVTKIAVAQICRTAGYHGAEPAALRSLADIAGRYLQSLARSAAASANSRGRTDANLFDVARAVEDHALPRGFAGAADPSRPLLRSAAVRDLVGFVESVDEVPFPRPMRAARVRIGASAAARPRSFAELGREPPWAHVPRWLPCFPERWGEEKRLPAARAAKLGWDPPPVEEGSEGEERGKAEAAGGRAVEIGKTMRERERVRFRLRLGEKNGEIGRRKRRGLMLMESGEDELESGGKRRRELEI